MFLKCAIKFSTRSDKVIIKIEKSKIDKNCESNEKTEGHCVKKNN